MSEASNNSINITSTIDQNNLVGSSNGQNSGTLAASEDITSSSIFNLTDRLQIFSYLVTSNRVRWYRVIMRFFLQCHRDLYRYQITAQEVRDTVRTMVAPQYSMDPSPNRLNATNTDGSK